MTVAIAIAEKLIAKLNAGVFSQSIQAIRYYQPKFKLEQINALKVCVVPREVERNNHSRSTNEQRTTIQIGVLQRCEPTNASIDPLIQLTDEMALSLEDYEFQEPHSIVTSVRIAPLFDPDLLDKNRQFTSIIEVSVRSFL
jgi:hypothetical protein